MNRFDVLVIGGGPAGVALARGLAAHGHRIALVARPPDRRRSLALSIPPSARRLLDAAGLLSFIEAAGFVPNTGHTAWWAGAECRATDFPRPGFQADAAELHRALRRALTDSGVHVFEAAARRLRETGDGWEVECERDAAAAPLTLCGAWLADASGRAGVLARSEGRIHERDLRTTALVQSWREDAPGRHGGGMQAGHTQVESYRDGWAWSVPLGDGLRSLTVMVDAGQARFRGRSLEDIHADELAKSPNIAAGRAAASAAGPVRACSASRYVARRFGRPGAVLVGDAGAFIDPLSSHGVARALGSAWLAGIVLHTCLTDADTREAALNLFDARERAFYMRHHAEALPYYSAAATTYQDPFWIRRLERAREITEAQPSEEIVTGDVELREDAAPALREALSRLRAAARLDLVPGPTLRRARRPVVAGDRIVLDDHLATADSPRGIRYVRGIDLRRLVADAPRHDDVAGLFAARPDARTGLPDFLLALAYATAHGFLAWRD